MIKNPMSSSNLIFIVNAMQKEWHTFNYFNQFESYIRILDKGISYSNFPSIGRVVVSPAHRGKNFGIEIMKEGISICKKMYGDPIKISAQCYLERFYTNLGFKIISEEYMEDNIPHYAMLYEELKLG